MLLSVSSIQFADGLAAVKVKLEYNLQKGDTQMLIWTIINTQDEPIKLEVYAKGEGAHLLTFEKHFTLDAKSKKDIEVFVIVPEDHVNNIEYRPHLFALQKAVTDTNTATGMVFNQQMRTIPIIKIGDNPVYTPPVGEKTEASKVEEKKEEIVEQIKEETMEEKLARINAANLDNESSKDVVKDSVNEKSVMDKEPTSDSEPTCGAGTTAVNGICVLNKAESEPEGGGCLIATATFGSEMAPQVQLLREIRDNQLMNTDSGVSFMSGFNQLYYSFSPIIADMERENPAFKELVKIGITPLLSSLSIMEFAESDSEVLGYGIGVILLNLGMYAGIPAFGILKFYQFRRN